MACNSCGHLVRVVSHTVVVRIVFLHSEVMLISFGGIILITSVARSVRVFSLSKHHTSEILVMPLMVRQLSRLNENVRPVVIRDRLTFARAFVREKIPHS